MINFYSDVFKRKSHMLVPLNDLVAGIAKQKKGEKKKKISKFQMLKEHLDAFNKTKEIIKSEVNLATLTQLIYN